MSDVYNLFEDIVEVDIEQNIIEDCIKDYYSNTEFRTASMQKADPNVHIDYFTSLVSKVTNSDVSFCSGNYYKHTLPYMPHTDYKEHLNNSINFVIPLSIKGDASLIIFDQLWSENSVTWDMNLPIPENKTNKNTKGSPIDYDIKYTTGKPFQEDIHQKYLSFFKLEDLKGLSANIFNFVPSKGVIFDNRKIHCTSHERWEKLGLSLRFKYAED